MDSCDYVCAFDIKGADDAPEDFELPPNFSLRANPIGSGGASIRRGCSW